MKLKTNNTAKKSVNVKKNKSPNKQAKGVEVRKEKSKVVVKPTVLKKEAEKTKVELPPNPVKVLQQELWIKAIENVSNKSGLSDEESSIIKLLADYKKNSSIPQKSSKLKNFITKGFSKYKDTSDDVLNGIYSKISNEFKTIGGNAESISESKVNSKKVDAKANKTKSKKEVSNEEEVTVDEENSDGDDDNDDEDDDEMDDEDEVDDEVEGMTLGDSDDEEESEEEKPKPKAKGNKAANKNGKSQPNKGKNGSKFKGGKIQKNKKFSKKK